MGVPWRLFLAARKGDIGPIEAWLSEGNDVNETFTVQAEGYDADEDGPYYVPVEGSTLLSTATSNSTFTAKHVKLVAWLLARGADPNVSNQEGYSPLHSVCQGGPVHDLRVVSLLIKHHGVSRGAQRGRGPENDCPRRTPFG